MEWVSVTDLGLGSSVGLGFRGLGGLGFRGSGRLACMFGGSRESLTVESPLSWCFKRFRV